MTQSIESMIEVLQAYQAGKKIEYLSYDRWVECNQPPMFNFGSNEHRIAPEPKKRVKLEAWLTTFGSLDWRKENTVTPGTGWIRVPSEDKEIEI